MSKSQLQKDINKLLKGIINWNTHLKDLSLFFKKYNIHWTEICYQETGDTILHCAARVNIANAIDYLLNNFEPNAVDCKNKDDKTALHEAAQFGSLAACEVLVQHGANVNALKKADWTPLMLACTKITENRDARLNIVELLLNNGSLINYKNKDGWNCIHLISREGDVEFFNLLISKKADIGARTRNGRTGLHIAALHGNLDIIKGFIIHKLDVNTRDNCGNTPLHESVLGNHLEICKTLIDHGADTTSKNNSDYGLMHLAVSEGHTDMIEFIINELNFDVNETNKDGLTALHCAARTKQMTAYTILVKSGARQDVRDKFDRTPKDYH